MKPPRKINPAIIKRAQELHENPEIARAIGRIGGQSKSVRKSLTSHLNGLKNANKWDDDDIAFFLKTIEDPETDIIFIKKYLTSGMTNDFKTEDKARVAKVLTELHKATFGDKKKIEVSGVGSVNFVFNIQAPKPEVIESENENPKS